MVISETRNDAHNTGGCPWHGRRKAQLQGRPFWSCLPGHSGGILWRRVLAVMQGREVAWGAHICESVLWCAQTILHYMVLRHTSILSLRVKICPHEHRKAPKVCVSHKGKVAGCFSDSLVQQVFTPTFD